MTTTTARVPTANASRLLQQLCKHWGHKFDVTFDASKGTVTFPAAHLSLAAEPDALVVTLSEEAAGDDARMRGVVESHLDRFAFREAPLSFAWMDAEPVPD